MNIALLAGTHSGCGKTSVMLALLQAMQQAGLSVASFKTGPDFLDPLWHQAVTGKASYNVDTQMVGLADSLRQLQTATSDYALIEGVMGLFDGRTGVGEAGSSLDLARVLGASVLLVVDVSGMSGSVVPLVQGFCQSAKAKGVTIAGIVANRVGSAYHAELIKTFLAEHEQPPLVAWLEKNAPVLPERHLGLVMPEAADVPDFSAAFHVDIDLLTTVFTEFSGDSVSALPVTGLLKGKQIAIARDAVCCFIYPANVDWLRAEGAKLVFFSPLAGELVPENSDALWLAGGYPELYAEQLSQSATWASLQAFIEADKPVLAECGGMMLLGQELIDIEARAWTMAGILPFSVRMQPRLVSLGYRELTAGARGHEFHYSKRYNDETLPPCFELERGDNGVTYKNLRAAYIHWYFPSHPETVAQWFLKAC
ncbi:hydrogenobyrinic acid a,c-diamide synthase (glutamine-hydrolyzing) [Crenothrix sp. D3]|nr:hydrogenobyrinic acid a,c-diamide synthase (glutamine-hydrolyzing) [Crenothrix sp. D3]